MQLVLLEGQADKPQKNQDAELTLPPTTWFKAVGPLPFVRAGEMIRPGPELPRCWYQNLAESASISAGAGPGYGWSRVRTMVRPSHHRQRPGVELAEGAEQTGGHSWRLSIHSISAIQRRRRFWRWSLMRCAWGRFFPLFFAGPRNRDISGHLEFVREDRTRSEIEQLTSCRGIGATSVNNSRMEEAS
jgi:hypothetical protein